MMTSSERISLSDGAHISVDVELDSIAATSGFRLTTFILTYPRFIHSELLTHRAFSRNSESSRANPVKNLLAEVESDPVLPKQWSKNRSGMQATEVLSDEDATKAEAIWREAAADAARHARALSELGLHKQYANRIIEPFLTISTILTATDFANFFAQRVHADAQPDIECLSGLMYEARAKSVPQTLALGEWHLPMLRTDDSLLDLETRQKISVARCARLSYLTHLKTRDIEKDLGLFADLLTGGYNGHWSPFEHQATPAEAGTRSGNVSGWRQYRKDYPQENVAIFP